LEGAVEALRRGSKRQAAPFSKGKPNGEPARLGRKKGKAHGRHGHRMAPPDPDRTLDTPLPGCCPHCGDEVHFERWDDQYHTELLEPRPITTRFRVGVGRCRGW
jgi:transposase